eukprot:8371230-Alexandrium_andersonii.AAC.1
MVRSPMRRGLLRVRAGAPPLRPTDCHGPPSVGRLASAGAEDGVAGCRLRRPGGRATLGCRSLRAPSGRLSISRGALPASHFRRLRTTWRRLARWGRGDRLATG